MAFACETKDRVKHFPGCFSTKRRSHVTAKMKRCLKIPFKTCFPTAQKFNFVHRPICLEGTAGSSMALLEVATKISTEFSFNLQKYSQIKISNSFKTSTKQSFCSFMLDVRVEKDSNGANATCNLH